MREILFRGKRLQGGEWVEGHFFKSDINKRERNSGKATLIFTPDCDTFITVPECHNSFMVVSDTVGQYTGLKDKNGKRIFEGDIVKTDKFSEPNKQYIIKYDLQFGAFIGQDRYNVYFVTFDGDSGEFEVIGNIYDNPELLEK